MSLMQSMRKKIKNSSLIQQVMWLGVTVYLGFFFYRNLQILFLLSDESSTLYQNVLVHNLYFWPELIGDNENTHYLQKIFIWIDKGLFLGEGWLPFIINLVGMALVGYSLYWMVSRLFSLEKDNWLYAILVAFVYVLWFSPLQEINVVWEFYQLRMVDIFLITFSYLLLFFSTERHNSMYLVVSVALIVLSINLSNENMVVLGPFIVLLLIFRPLYYKYIIFLSLTFIGFFFWINGSLDMSFVDIFSFKNMGYFLTYLGGIFFDVSGKECFSLAQLAGILMIVGVLFVCLSIWKDRKEKIPIIILALLLYYFIENFVYVYISRIGNPTEYFLYTYKDNYLSLFSWSLWFILMIYYTKNKTRESLLYVLWTMMLVFIGYQFFVFPEKTKYKVSKIEIMMGIEKVDKLRKLYPNVEYSSFWKPLVKKSFFDHHTLAKIVREKKMIFTNEILVGEKVQQAVLSSDMIGYIDKSKEIPNYKNVISVEGWVFDKKQKTSPEDLYIVDLDNRVVGYAVSGIKREDVAKIFGTSAKKSGFKGYILQTQKKKLKKYYFIDKKSMTKRAFALP